MSQLAWTTIKDYRDAPGTCGVYEYWSGKDLLYIGKAVNLKARLASHAQNAKLDAKEALIVAGDTIRYTTTDTEFKALLLESELIRQFRPPHNRVWKDDKSYLYIVVDLADPFPRPHFARAHDLNPKSKVLNHKSHVFGPFPSSTIAEEVLRSIRRLIPFCMTKNIGKRACFYSHLGLCNPCPSGHHQDPFFAKKQYRKQIRQLIKILEGNIEPVIQELTKQIKTASDTQDFETALELRTKIERFTRFITSHRFSDHHFTYNNSSEKLSSLETILKSYFLNLKSLSRIECYDASNSALFDSTVSLVVMTDGLLDHGQYRRFKIKNPRARSDFDRLDEALTRRLKNTTWPQPNLIVIDGGVPQLRRLQRIFDKQVTPPFYLGLAKHPDRLVIPRDDQFSVIRLTSDHPALQLLQQLRDEAHRFANSYRRILEHKRTKL